MAVTTVSSCRVVFYSYRNEFPSGSSADTVAREIEVKKEVLSFEYAKSLGQPSGQFTLQLTADRNWKKEVFADNWLEVFLTNEGVEYRRLLGNIDRVSQFSTKNDEGLLETSYIVSGRDFGKVVEDTEIWFNPISTTPLKLGTIYKSGSPNELVEGFLDLFLGGKIPLDVLNNQPQFNQWKIPSALLTKIPSSPQSSTGGGPRFTDILAREIQSVSGKKAIANLSAIQGNLWSILISNSNDVVNELYLEMQDEVPTIFFRTKPFAKKGSSDLSGISGIASEINYFIDLEQIVVQTSDIIGQDLGYSSQERFNLFLTTTTNDLLDTSSNIVQMKGKYPKLNISSIQRNGLRPMDLDTEFALIQSGKKSQRNNKLLLEWNDLIYHWFNNSIYLEAGTIELIKAAPYLRVGKTLVIENQNSSPNGRRQYLNQDKILYIEGYTDSWTYPGEWHQTVQLTRGQYLVRGREKYTYVEDTSSKIYTGQTIIPRTK